MRYATTLVAIAPSASVPYTRCSGLASAALMAASAVCLGEGPAIEVQLIPIDPAVVTSARSGLVMEVPWEEGQVVEEGQLVARLDGRQSELEAQRARTEYEVKQFQAEGDVDIRHAEKAFALALSELARGETINARVAGSVSVREIESLKLGVEKAKLAVEQSRRNRQVLRLEATLKKIEADIAELKVEQGRLLSPISGVVTKAHKQTGSWVEAGDAVLEITPVDTLRAEGFLSEDLAAQTPRGAPVTLVVESPAVGSFTLPGKLC